MLKGFVSSSLIQALVGDLFESLFKGTEGGYGKGRDRGCQEFELYPRRFFVLTHCDQ